MDQSVCSECGVEFTRPGARGPIPTRCPSCKQGRKRVQHAEQERDRLQRLAAGQFRCGRCKVIKPGSEFASSQRRDGSWCRDCFRSSYVERSGGVTTKQCERCGTDFTVTRRDSRRKFCGRDCKGAARDEKQHAMMLAAKADNACEECGKPIPEMRANARWCSNACAIKGRTTPEQRARWKLADRLRKYGVTVTEYEAWLAAGCAICGTHESQDGRAMSIDHCHVSGKPRGILCGHCNKGLGLFLDRPELLRRAADYLEK